MTDVHQARTTRRGLLAGTGVVAGATALGGPTTAAYAGDRGGGGLASDDWPRGPGARIRPQHADVELRAMLRQIDPDRIEANVRKLASFGTRHTLSSQDDPVRGIGAARDWIFGRVARYAAASGGRMTVELQSFVQPADGDRIPVRRPRSPTSARRCAATSDAEPDLRRHRALRLAGHRRHERHRRRTRRRRRRVGRGGVAGAGPGDGHAPQPTRRSSSPQSPARSRGSTGRRTWPQHVKAAGVDVAGHVHQRHRRQQHRRRRHPRPHSVRLFAAGSHRPARTPPLARCGSRSAARTTRRRASWPGSSTEVAGPRPPGWTSGSSTGATATSAAATTSRS